MTNIRQPSPTPPRAGDTPSPSLVTTEVTPTTAPTNAGAAIHGMMGLDQLPGTLGGDIGANQYFDEPLPGTIGGDMSSLLNTGSVGADLPGGLGDAIDPSILNAARNALSNIRTTATPASASRSSTPSGTTSATSGVANNSTNFADGVAPSGDTAIERFNYDGEVIPEMLGGGISLSKLGGASLSPQSDYRLRIKAIRGQENRIYGPNNPSNILSPLYSTSGLLFPYTPTINFTQTVDYQSASPVHSNFDFNSYTRTPHPEISISAKFAIQNEWEGRYVLAVLHFLRVVSKMHFGELDQSAGLPPPILHLTGYGTYMFHDLKIVVKSHSWTFDENIDHVNIWTAGGFARLPTLFTLTVNVLVQQTPLAARKRFNLEAFRTGALMTSGGWI